MEIIGIIAEYNPFHLGHLYQINKIKEMYPSSIIIVITSTFFSQRGEVSVLNKWDKAKIALVNNVGLVVELPTILAVQSADLFAKHSLKILNELKINKLVFGSELGNVDILTNLANTQLNNKEYDKKVKEYLDKGLNYPTSTSKALFDITNFKIENPNDLLGLSYIKEIIKNNYPITPVTIKRTNNYHGNNQGNILSASEIRQKVLNNKDIENNIPENTKKYLNNISISDYFNYLKYKIILNKDNLHKYAILDEGLENRIQKFINKSNTYDELIKNIKTKRYTYNKISRILLHILLDITKEDIKNIKIDYVRILGFNNQGKTHLNKIKKDLNINLITKYKENTSNILDIEHKALLIYSLIVDNKERDYLFKMEYNNKPVIKE